MMSRWSPLWITLGIMGLFAAISAHYYPLLPERLATHFGPNGQPDGWMAKLAFLKFYAIFLLFIEAMTTGMGTLIGVIPAELINVPNRDYWLAPERRATTFAYIRTYTNWMGAATGALLIALLQSIFRANQQDVIRLGSEVWVLLAMFVAFMIINTIGLVMRFAPSRSR